MQEKPTRKNPGWLQWILKLVIIGAALFLVSKRLSSEHYEGIFVQPLHHAGLYLPIFTVLWLINLLLDARIWQRVHAMLANISLKRALQTNLVCYALSFITPVNSGELAGRYIMLEPELDRRKAAFLTYWSHFPRLIVKLVLGAGVALVFLIPEGDNALALALLWVLLGAMIIAGYLRFRRIQQWLSRRAWRRIALVNYLLADKPATSDKIRLLVLACLKFLSYNLQFAVLLTLWSGLDLSPSLLMSVVGMYVIGALAPTIPLTDFLIKAGVAFLVFDHPLITDSMLLNAALLTWLVNVAIPSLVGGIIIMRTDLLSALRKRP